MMKRFLLLSLFSASAVGQGFGPQQVITAGAVGATGVRAVDLDGDGDPDIVASSYGDDRITWFENFGSGIFGPGQLINANAGGPRGVHAADLDGDGDADIVVAAFDGNRVAWHQNLGGGSFALEVVISTTASGAEDVYAHDLDGDGDLDVLFAAMAAFKIAWHENLGGGTFGPEKLLNGSASGARSVRAADLDGDGDADVISGADQGYWYENLGGGTFAPGLNWTFASGGHYVDAADLDGDGDLDLLDARVTNDLVAWYRNVGGGSFTFSSSNVLPGILDQPGAVLAADLDGDGDPDVASTSATNGTIVWWKNLGGAAFSAPEQLTSAAAGAADLHVADINGDGDLDLFSASEGDDKIAWYENLIAGAPVFEPCTVQTWGITGVSNCSGGSCNFGNRGSLGMGDFDGDGNMDAVVGASGTFPAPLVQVRSGIDGTILHQVLGAPGSGFGGTVDGAGDVNGDGLDDFVVGAMNELSNRGVVRVYSGADASVLRTITGQAAGAQLGRDVAGAGDTNADGHDDIIIGSNAGTVLVISGVDGAILYQLSGLSADAVSGCGDANADGHDDFAVNGGPAGQTSLATIYSGFDGSVLHVVPFGGSMTYRVLAPAGDMNLDGYDDLLAGSPNANLGPGNASGVVHVVSGLDGSFIHVVPGYTFNTSLGWSVGGGGDVNGDGYPDFTAGGPGDATFGSSSGRTDLFSGLDGTRLFSVLGTQGDSTGTACGIADTDGDGFAEVLVGSRGQDYLTSFPVSGTVQVVGVDATPSFSGQPNGQVINATVGVPMAYSLTAADRSCAPSNVLTLSVTGEPAGLTHSQPLPASQQGAGASITIQASWTPSNQDVGTHALTYRAMDSDGRERTHTIIVVVAECYLLLGVQPLSVSLGGPDVLLVEPVWTFPVDLSNTPSFTIPPGNSLLGISFFAQVAMWNQIVFPADPLQLSHGLEVVIGGGVNAYGNGGSGMMLGLFGLPIPGQTVTFHFSIPGG